MTDKTPNDFEWYHVHVHEDAKGGTVTIAEHDITLNVPKAKWAGPYMMAAQLLARYKAQTGEVFKSADDKPAQVTIDRMGPGYIVRLNGVIVHRIPDDGTACLYGETLTILAAKGGSKKFAVGVFSNLIF